MDSFTWTQSEIYIAVHKAKSPLFLILKDSAAWNHTWNKYDTYLELAFKKNRCDIFKENNEIKLSLMQTELAETHIVRLTPMSH